MKQPPVHSAKFFSEGFKKEGADGITYKVATVAGKKVWQKVKTN